MEPTNAAALALRIGCDSGTIYGWIQEGAMPRADRGRAVAETLGVPFEWLTNDAESYPPKNNAVSLAAALSLLPESEREAFSKILRDPVERRAWIASWNARQGRP
jgi:transcriptional regulator with XRE-family HTH domain